MTQNPETVVLAQRGRNPSLRSRFPRTRAARAGGVVATFVFLVLLGLSLADRPARAEGLNACGCSQTETGACVCSKQAKCGCPGMCEPVGCAAKREKEWNKQLEEETRHAEERAAAQRAEREAKKRAAEAAARGDDEDDSDSDSASGSASATNKESAKESAKKATTKARHMSASQEKSLRRLIDVYLAAHPDEGSRSLSDIRADLAGG